MLANRAKEMIDSLFEQQGTGGKLPMPQYDNQGYFKNNNANQTTINEFVNKKALIQRPD